MKFVKFRALEKNRLYSIYLLLYVCLNVPPFSVLCASWQSETKCRVRYICLSSTMKLTTLNEYPIMATEQQSCKKMSCSQSSTFDSDCSKPSPMHADNFIDVQFITIESIYFGESSIHLPQHHSCNIVLHLPYIRTVTTINCWQTKLGYSHKNCMNKKIKNIKNVKRWEWPLKSSKSKETSHH